MPAKTARTYSTQEVAEMTNRAQVTIRQIAQRYEDTKKPIGTKVGRDWRFTDKDIERIKAMLPADTRPRRLPKVAP